MDYEKIKSQIPTELKKTITFQCAGFKPAGKLALGFGLAENIGHEISNFNPERILLITDQTIINFNIEKIIIESLEKQRYKYDIFSEVEAEPNIETARAIQKTVRKNKYSTVIGLGGGSVLDMAKVASLMATNQGDIGEYLNGTPLTNEGLPNVLLPTTSGSGSEVSPFIVISQGEEKLFIKHPLVYATIALIDPLLTVTMPPKVTASTGLDALTHGVEGLLANQNPISEALSYKCVEYVFKYLEKAYQNNFDLKARYFMSYASVLGMLSYSLGGGLYAHSMSYLLTIYEGLPHGIGCGIALPYTLLFNYDYIKPILKNFSNLILSGGVETTDEQEIALKVIKEFHNLMRKINVSTNLKELNINKNRIQDFAQKLKNNYYRNNNPRILGEKEAMELVGMIWEGDLKFI